MTMNDRSCLLASLKCALWGCTFDEELNAESFSRIMKLAEEQVVAGLVFDVLSNQKTKIGYGITVKYLSLKEQIKNSNYLLNNELKEFVKKAAANQFNYLIVKGQTIGLLYPNANLRASGDIDILMKGDYLSNKLELERMLNIHLPDKMKEKELSFYQGKTRFDLHKNIVDFCLSKHQLYWDNLLNSVWDENNNVELEDLKVRILPPTVNAVYVFLHLFFHFIREGVALRQFCDWAIVLHHYKDEIDRNLLAEILNNLGVINAYRAFGTIVIDSLGLPIEEFPIYIDENDRRWKDMILDDIFNGGNFGRKNHHLTSVMGYKFETMCLMVRNNIRYYSLAPSEMRMMIPKMLRINLRLLFG